MPEKGAEATAETERLRAQLRRCVDASPLCRRVVAERVGMSPSSLSGMLKEGGTRLHLRRLLAVLAALGISSEDFFTGLYGVPSAELALRLTALTDVLLEDRILTRDQLVEAYERRKRVRRPHA